jgi:hypothetical protein
MPDYNERDIHNEVTVTRKFRSTFKAFEALGLPIEEHERFRFGQRKLARSWSSVFVRPSIRTKNSCASRRIRQVTDTPLFK